MKTARHKLNQANFFGIFLIAGMIGWITGSPVIFIIVVILLAAGAVHSGDIRIQPRPKMSAS